MGFEYTGGPVVREIKGIGGFSARKMVDIIGMILIFQELSIIVPMVINGLSQADLVAGAGTQIMKW